MSFILRRLRRIINRVWVWYSSRGLLQDYTARNMIVDNPFEITCSPPPQVCIDFESRMPLTRPSSPFITSSKTLQSSLARLPYEIRQQIWRNVLEGHTFHLSISDERLYGLLCVAEDSGRCNAWLGSRQSRAPDEIRKKRQMLSLLLTCRQ
jgi:hypothetical protein